MVSFLRASGLHNIYLPPNYVRPIRLSGHMHACMHAYLSESYLPKSMACSFFTSSAPVPNLHLTTSNLPN